MPQVIFEQVRVGNTMRVTAVDVASGTEVVFQAPAATSPAQLQRLGLMKLKYVMEKKNGKV